MKPQGEDRVLIAAADQFAESGFAAATVRQIAERCGMSTGSLFNRFASKRELLVAAVAEGTVRPDAHVRRGCRVSPIRWNGYGSWWWHISRRCTAIRVRS